MAYITPALIAAVIVTALIRRKSVYGSFIEGAGDGLKLLPSIFPPLVAVLTAAAMLRASGVLETAINFLAPFTAKIGIPPEIMPLILIRPISGSGAVGILSEILTDCGADGYAGRLASVICGSTETTFYCLAVYFAGTRVKSTLRAVPGAVIGDIAGIAAAVFVLNVLGL